MIIKEDYLITINSKNRVQRIKTQIELDHITKVFTIHRVTGQYGSKEIHQPDLVITEGKVTRTASEQAILQYNAILKNYLDKGYKKLSALTDRLYTSLSEEEIKTLLGGDVVSDQSGVPKPMLAKSADHCTSGVWDKSWYCSRKLDGARCMFYYKDGKILTASRGGGNYNVATKHLTESPELLKIFEYKPDLILDGELYHHGSDWPLQRISGLARQQEWKEECRGLEYWIYDYVDTNVPFRERLGFLQKISTELQDSPGFRVVPHVLISGYLNIKTEHDKYVHEGYEGLVARNPDKEYGINKRSAIYMIKLKSYQDAEFEVVGIKEGLRPEDLCFLLKTREGKEFAAKPTGNIATRLHYLEHWQDYVGQFATCKYFYYSKDNIPQQPILKHFRPIDE